MIDDDVPGDENIIAQSFQHVNKWRNLEEMK